MRKLSVSSSGESRRDSVTVRPPATLSKQITPK
jgi:hypothetical protein